MGQTIICHHVLCSVFYTRIIRSPRWGVLTTALLIFRFEYRTQISTETEFSSGHILPCLFYNVISHTQVQFSIYLSQTQTIQATHFKTAPCNCQSSPRPACSWPSDKTWNVLTLIVLMWRMC